MSELIFNISELIFKTAKWNCIKNYGNYIQNK